MEVPELLAPAGGIAAFRAAIASGADAVYLGLPSFNARRNADNLTLEELSDACAFAHARGAKVYVTLNTVILPHEMPDAVGAARDAWLAGADAFIVQDLGLARELRAQLPQARLHVSTQMNVHSAAGLRAAARLGASRVTLARELSLAEVAALVEEGRGLGVEVEAFAHGALCVCYSGQCLMSSLIGGRSANRGLCAQACRLPYELQCDGRSAKAPGEHLLSPADLCSIDVLGELAEAGVASLKVEGRMKAPEYVATVTATYRRLLDELAAGRPASPTPEDRTALASAFSRGFTTAYLEGERGNDMMSYQRPNNRGAFVGRVRAVEGQRAYLALEQPLAPGDLIEFWTGRGHARLEVTAPLAARDKRSWVALDSATKGVRKLDRVFKVRSAPTEGRLDAFDPRVPVVGSVRLRLGEPLRMAFSVAPEGALGGEGEVARAIVGRLSRAHAGALPSASAQGEPVEAARSRAVAPEEVLAHVGRMGSTPFSLVDLQIELDEGVGIGFSTLHRLRSEALERLLEELLAPWAARTATRLAASESRRPQAPGATAPRAPYVAALATNPACARAAKRAGAQAIYVPAACYVRGGAMEEGVVVPEAQQAGYPKGCRLLMPEVEHDPLGSAREAAVGCDLWEHARSHAPLMADSLGAMQRAAELGLPFEVGSHVPLLNESALCEAHAFGAEAAWLSPELSLAQIAGLGPSSPLPLGIAVFGRQMLMTLEHCALMSEGPCEQDCAHCRRRLRHHRLKDRKGYEFPVATDSLGRSRLYNSVPLDAVPALSELLEAGVSAFLVDATLLGVEQTAQAVGRAVHALERAQAGGAPEPKLREATSGHLFRGVA